MLCSRGLHGQQRNARAESWSNMRSIRCPRLQRARHVTLCTAVESMPAQTPANSISDAKEQLLQKFKGQLFLAPLTRGGNLPFRRLCCNFGAQVTMGEMAFARMLLKGEPVERARLKPAPNEQCFGVQIATNVISEGVGAAKMAADSGASFLDLNCGCPIHEATRRGLGAVLLRKPAKLARLVAGMVEESPIPITVKVRIGTSEKDINLMQVVRALSETGATAVTVHGRTMEQRYKRPANWQLIQDAANDIPIPLIGNGDILTYYEARSKLAESGCLALMTGRGALIKPWIFQEFAEGRMINPNSRERILIYRTLVSHMRDHFGADEKGKTKAFYFLPWHFEWFARYRPFPQEAFEGHSREHPLIATRWELTVSGELESDLTPLDRLLRCDVTACHKALAHALWDAPTDEAAVEHLEKMALEDLPSWEEQAKVGDDRDRGQQIAVQG